MGLFELDSVLISAALTLAVVPLLLSLWFLLHGRRSRISDLQSYFSATQTAGELVDNVENPEQAFRDYLTERYQRQHHGRRYVVPLITFHVVYWVGLYWSFVAMSVYASPDTGNWPAGLRDAVVLGAAGFLGGVLTVVWHLFWRSILTDLQPKVFMHAASRLLVAPIVGVVVGSFLGAFGADGAPALFLAFGAGLFVDATLWMIELRWRDRMGLSNALQQPLPVRNIEGIDSNDAMRLWEEGITDAEHLAVETIEHLLINTKYSLERIIDWKDQAILYAYVADEIPRWRAAMNRGALDVLGMAKKYYTDDRPALIAALAQAVGKPEPLLERFIDTIYQDPRVRQLWRYLSSAYPSEPAEALDEVAGGEDGVVDVLPPPAVAPGEPTPERRPDEDEAAEEAASEGSAASRSSK